MSSTPPSPPQAYPSIGHHARKRGLQPHGGMGGIGRSKASCSSIESSLSLPQPDQGAAVKLPQALMIHCPIKEKAPQLRRPSLRDDENENDHDRCSDQTKAEETIFARGQVTLGHDSASPVPQ
jgi:hypothetical protein